MEFLAQEMFKLACRLLGALLLLFLVMSFWGAAPGDPGPGTAGPEAPAAVTESDPGTPAPPPRAIRNRIATLSGPMWHMRLAWLRLYQKAGAPALHDGTLTPADAKKAGRSIGTVAAAFFGVALFARYAGRRLTRRSRRL